MLSGLILNCAMSSFIYGYYHLKQEKKYAQMISDLINLESYSLDYIKDPVEITGKGELILAATTNSTDHEANKNSSIINKSILFKDKNVYFSSIQEYVSEKEDLLWQQNNITFNFNTTNDLKSHFIQIKNSDPNHSITFYNLQLLSQVKDLKQILDQNIKITPLQRWRLNFQNYKLGEFGIVSDQQFLFVGKIQRENNGACFMQPKFILGENKDLFMQFLDKRIMQTSKKSMIAFGVGLSMFIGHFIYFRVIKRLYLFDNNTQVNQQSNQQTILPQPTKKQEN